MIQLKGRSFVNSFGEVGEGAFQEWLRQFHDIPPQHLRTAFRSWRKAGTDDYLDAVKLRRLALAESGNVYPTVESAYFEACEKASQPLEKEWTHPIIYFSGKRTGWFELRTETKTKTLPLFRANYQELVARSIKGEVFELPKLEPVLQIEQKPASKAFAQEHLSQLTDFLNA